MILMIVPRFSLANLLTPVLEYRYKFDLNLPVMEHRERLR